MDDERLVFAFAHDVRAHLRTVLTRIQLVQRGGGATLPAEDQRMLEEAATAIGSIGSLVTAVVAYHDANAGDGVMQLGLLLRGSLLEKKPALAEAQAEVEVENDLDVEVPVGLQNICSELLTNACKFRYRNRALQIRVATRITSDDTLEVRVSDNGPGVEAAYLEKIFVPFQRLHSRDEFPGHGLGLATCRRIAAAWGGTMAAESGEDGGLTVRITVPGCV
jgi:signal transduction histidine kinase